MTPFFMIEIQFNSQALYRYLHMQGLSTRDPGASLNYGIHAWLGEAFGNLSPKPWRLFMDRRRPPRILCYSPHNADAFRQALSEFADPGVFRVCPKPEVMISSRRMPLWQTGRRLGFQTLVCPVGRKARSGIEKDLFLIHASSQEKESTISREEVYCNWAKERIERHSTAVDIIRMSGFRLSKQVRKTQPSNKPRALNQIVRPQAQLDGELTISKPEEFHNLLASGIGRHRSFGFGMLLLRPPS